MTAKAQFPHEQASDGSFERQDDAFRERVTADGSSGYPAESWTLSPLRLARLSLGLPHGHRS